MNTQWNARIKIARELSGLSKANFARLLDVSASTTTEWESGNTKSLSDENLVRVCELLHIRGQWLVRGTLPMEATIIHDEWSLSERSNAITAQLIPFPAEKSTPKEERQAPSFNAKIGSAYELASPTAKAAMEEICKALVFARDEDVPQLARMILDAVLDRPAAKNKELRPDQLELLELYEKASATSRVFAKNALNMSADDTEPAQITLP